MVYSLMHTVFSWLLEEYKCVRGKVMGVYGRGGRGGGEGLGSGGGEGGGGGTASLKVGTHCQTTELGVGGGHFLFEFGYRFGNYSPPPFFLNQVHTSNLHLNSSDLTQEC